MGYSNSVDIMWIIVAVVLVFIALLWGLTGRWKGLPPGPPCYPIVGNLGLIKPSDSTEVHRRLRKIYGDIYTVMIFHKPVIFVNGFHHIRELFVKYGDIFSERPNVYFTEVVTKGKGVIWSSGPLWKEQRTFALITLRKFGIGRRCMESQIMEEIDCVMDEFEKYKTNAFDIQTQLNISVSNIICSVFFGKRFAYNDTKFKRLSDLLNKLFASITGSSPAFIFPWLRHFRIFNLDKTMGYANAFFDFVTEIVEEHRQRFDENNIQDYIDAFLLEQKQRANEPNSSFTDEQLKQSVRDFFVAGTETTSTTLRWVLLYLIHHRDWQNTLQNDIDDVIGQAQPKMEHRGELPRVEAFILEVQRSANIIPVSVPHTSNVDFMYNGYIFPKGAIVFGALHSVMSDPEIFPEPSTFKPGRFLDDSGKCCGDQKTKMIPFSIGHRSCLGESLARMELFLFFTRFLQKFEVKPEDSDHLPPLDGTLGITNMPQPFNLRLVKR